MKKILIVLILLIVSHDGEASNVACEDRFRFPNVNLIYCSNYGRRTDTEMLYYKGLAKALNTYIDHKREAGTLQGKKLEIRIDFADGGPVTDLSQGPTGYYVQFGPGSVVDLRQLLRIVDYFGSRSWRSFCPDWERKDPAIALHTLNRILDREVGEPDMIFFAGLQTVVFELDDLQVVFEDNRLFYVLAGRRLDLEPDDPTPVKAGDRYLFGSKGAIHVYENGSEILRRPWTYGVVDGAPHARVFRSWVNIGN
ncbi:MAG TPA: hypothetical protein VLX28_12315, partial [Thermoanaerobaculia bacterium]|nr:hypothetical protein [Thermoanaerobaculia bacterium]